MTYWRFITYNVVGGVVWVAIFVFGGYLFGNQPWVKRNFSIVIIAIILISVLPIVFEFFRHRMNKSKEGAVQFKSEERQADQLAD